jgi:anti-anti-sigma factor
MKLNPANHVLRIDGGRELSGATAGILLAAIRPSLDQYSVVEIDLSEIHTLDCRGLGALVGLRNAVRTQARRFHVVNPSVAVERLLLATHATHLFEPGGPQDAAPPCFERGPGQRSAPAAPAPW